MAGGMPQRMNACAEKYGGGKRKGVRPFDLTPELVRLAGIEPTTPWFVAKYSIQLSYSRLVKHTVLMTACL